MRREILRLKEGRSAAILDGPGLWSTRTIAPRVQEATGESVDWRGDVSIFRPNAFGRRSAGKWVVDFYFCQP